MKLDVAVFGLCLVTAANASGQADSQASYYKFSWSPDGRMLAFESTREGKSAIYTIQIDGTRLQRISPGQAEDIQPSWSPDGSRIVFASTRTGHEQLYVMDADGTNATRITNAPSSDFNPEYSPDGAWIVFRSQKRKGSNRYTIQVIRSDGTDRRLLSDTTHISEAPEWDGSTIIFVQMPITKPEWQGLAPRDLARARMKAYQFVSIQPDGSERKLLPPRLRPNHQISPDGHWIAYTRQVNGVWGLYVRDVRTGQERVLVQGAGTTPR
jgi:Tol biopolymer transport system component